MFSKPEAQIFESKKDNQTGHLSLFAQVLSAQSITTSPKTGNWQKTSPNKAISWAYQRRQAAYIVPSPATPASIRSPRKINRMPSFSKFWTAI
jgi:hypothetical protein